VPFNVQKSESRLHWRKRQIIKKKKKKKKKMEKKRLSHRKLHACTGCHAATTCSSRSGLIIWQGQLANRTGCRRVREGKNKRTRKEKEKEKKRKSQ
jgi:hypothetical protein